MDASTDAPVLSLIDVLGEQGLLAEADELGLVGVWDFDVRSADFRWSAETFWIFGRDPESFQPTPDGFRACIHPDDRAEVDRCLAAALAGTEPFIVEHRVVRPDGEVRIVQGRGAVIRAENGEPLRMFGLVRDVTREMTLRDERTAAVDALARSEERYRLLAENAWDVIWTMAVDGTITYVSPSVERVRGFTPQEAAAQTLDQIHPPESAKKVTDYFGRLYAAMAVGESVPIYYGEHEYYRKDGSIMLGELQVIPQLDDDGAVVQILGVTRDISEQRRYEQELNRLAITDPLTGVWNRRHGRQLFAADLAEARRAGPALSLLMIDIDRFKSVNDNFGHQVGDLVLVELCRRLSEQLRSADVLARWGGEEFVIVMRQCAIDNAVAHAEKLRDLVADTPFPHVGTVTVSIGAAQLQPNDDLDAWLNRADQAMYAAKASGRNAVRADG